MWFKDANGHRISVLNDDPSSISSFNQAHYSYTQPSSSRQDLFSRKTSSDDVNCTRLSVMHLASSSLSSPASSQASTPILSSSDEFQESDVAQNPSSPSSPYVHTTPPTFSQSRYLPAPLNPRKSNKTAYSRSSLIPSKRASTPEPSSMSPPPTMQPPSLPAEAAATNHSCNSSLAANAIASIPHRLTGRRRAGAPKSNKNPYPCPKADAFNCNAHFTTSGHATRHARTHTGEKFVKCPDCIRTFARKDNMEQHRKTHWGTKLHPRSMHYYYAVRPDPALVPLSASAHARASSSSSSSGGDAVASGELRPALVGHRQSLSEDWSSSAAAAAAVRASKFDGGEAHSLAASKAFANSSRMGLDVLAHAASCMSLPTTGQ